MRVHRYRSGNFHDLDGQTRTTLAHMRAAVERGEPLGVEDESTGRDVTAVVLVMLLARDVEAGNPVSIEGLRALIASPGRSLPATAQVQASSFNGETSNAAGKVSLRDLFEADDAAVASGAWLKR